MRSLPIILLAAFNIFSCSSGNEDFDPWTSGGSGDIVAFNFDCDSSDVDCPGAEKARERWGDGVHEVTCAWSCALNNTDVREPGFEDLAKPARHIITFRKVGDNCWRVYDVDTDKCGKDIVEPDPFG